MPRREAAGGVVMPKRVYTPEQRARRLEAQKVYRAKKHDEARLPLPSLEERVRIRVAAGLSKAEFGRKMGVSDKAVLYWERGVGLRATKYNNLYAAALAELQKESPVVNRAVEQFEHTWEAVLAAHNGYGWTDEQIARLRRLVKNVQMSIYKTTAGRSENEDDIRVGGGREDHTGLQSEPGVEEALGGTDRS